MANPFHIRVYAPEGSPEGTRIINRLTSTGIIFVFPREKWPEISKRSEFEGAGVYILQSYEDFIDPEKEDLPIIYIGQSDNIQERVGNHYQGKEFWELGIIFVAPGKLNSTHARWLEHALHQQATKANRSILNNGNKPSRPNISEAEDAEMQIFLNEIYQSLPLINIRVFEESGSVVASADKDVDRKSAKNTIIVAAREDGFKKVFKKQNLWWPVRIADSMIDKLKYIAAYRTKPTSAITHWAEIQRFEPYGNEENKYRVIFKGSAHELKRPIKIKVRKEAIQQSKYTNFDKLLKAKDLTDL